MSATQASFVETRENKEGNETLSGSSPHHLSFQNFTLYLLPTRKAKLSLKPDNSELEQIQEEYHIASHTDLEQAPHDKTELEEANLSLQAEVVEPHNSKGQQTKEESNVASQIDLEAQSIIAEKEQEVQVSQVYEIKPEKVPEIEKLQGENKLISCAEVEVQQTEEEGSVAFHIDHEAQSIIAEKEQEVQVSQVSEIKPEKVPEAEKIEDENKLISHAEVEVQQIEEQSNRKNEKEQGVQVSQVSEMKTEVPRVEKLHKENKLISHAEVESSGAVFEPSHVDLEAQSTIAEKE